MGKRLAFACDHVYSPMHARGLCRKCYQRLFDPESGPISDLEREELELQYPLVRGYINDLLTELELDSDWTWAELAEVFDRSETAIYKTLQRRAKDDPRARVLFRRVKRKSGGRPEAMREYDRNRKWGNQKHRNEYKRQWEAKRKGKTV